MALPEFGAAGNLPPGTHPATWTEVVARFGGHATDSDGGRQRQELLLGLRRALDHLSAVGCRRAWLGGSFVTDKERATGTVPGDVDVCWDLAGVDFERLAILAPALHPIHGDRFMRRHLFGGDYIAVSEPLETGFLGRFRLDRNSRPKGIVLLALAPSETEEA